jgi:hypothetical protein
MARRKPPKKLRKAKRPRNPLVPIVRGKGHAVEPSARRYKRRPKHPRKLSEDGS